MGEVENLRGARRTQQMTAPPAGLCPAQVAGVIVAVGYPLLPSTNRDWSSLNAHPVSLCKKDGDSRLQLEQCGAAYRHLLNVTLENGFEEL
ncbi:unnamed protein product [Lota lota]